MQVGRVLPHSKGLSQALTSTSIPTAKTLLPCILTADVRTAVSENDMENLYREVFVMSLSKTK